MKRKLAIYCMFVVWIAGWCVACKREEILKKDTENRLQTVQTSSNNLPNNNKPDERISKQGVDITMSKETYPRVDGSVAMLPLAQALCEEATGQSFVEIASKITHTNTVNAYHRLLSKEVDLIIIYNPTSLNTINEEKHAKKIKMKPIGTDGLAFFVSKENKIDGVTRDQLVDIYTGKLMNWSNLGGENQEILAFQKPDTAGSQALMKQLVIKDTLLEESPSMGMPYQEEDMIEEVERYNHQGNAIGYSTYYSIDPMELFGEVKVVSVDGVALSKETILDGTYPFTANFYVMIREDEPEDSNAFKLYTYLTTRAGQKLMQSLGYVPLEAQNDVTIAKKPMDETTIHLKEYEAIYIDTDNDSEISVKETFYDGQLKPIKSFYNASIDELSTGIIDKRNPFIVKQRLVVQGAGTEEEYTTTVQGLYHLMKKEYIIPCKYDVLEEIDESYYVGYQYDKESCRATLFNPEGEELFTLPDIMPYEDRIVYMNHHFWIHQDDNENTTYFVTVYDRNGNIVKRMQGEASWSYCNTFKDYLIVNAYHGKTSNFQDVVYDSQGEIYFDVTMAGELLKRSVTNETVFEVEDTLQKVGDDVYLNVIFDTTHMIIKNAKDIIWESEEKETYAYLNEFGYEINKKDQGSFYAYEGVHYLTQDGYNYTNYMNTDLFYLGEDYFEVYQTDTKKTYRYERKHTTPQDNVTIRNLGLKNFYCMSKEVDQGVIDTYYFGDVILTTKKNSGCTRIYSNETDEVDYVSVCEYPESSTGEQTIKDGKHQVYDANGTMIYESRVDETIQGVIKDEETKEFFLLVSRGQHLELIQPTGNCIFRMYQPNMAND